MTDAEPNAPVRQLRIATKAGRSSSREVNRRLVLQQLLRSSGMSRADIVRATGLTPATVSDLVAGLTQDGLLEERGRGPAKVGKPATLMGVRRNARSVIAVDISRTDVVTGSIVDLAGEVVRRVERDLDGRIGTDVVDLIIEIVDELIDLAPGPILGIGIGSPGVIRPDGVVIESDKLEWLDLDLAQMLEDRFEYPTYVVNDANASALAKYSVQEVGSASLMVVRIGRGIGAGLIINGQKHVGENFAAGEIGHLGLNDDGERCSCGNFGCLETMISVPKLRAAIEAGVDPDTVKFEAGQWMGRAVSAVICALDLGLIVLNGPPDLVDDVFIDGVKEAISARVPARVAKSVEVRRSRLGEDSVLLGASAAVLSSELGVA